MKRLPETIYVKMERDGDVNYPVAGFEPVDVAELGTKTTVGVYTLTRIENFEGVVKRTSKRENRA